MRKGGWGLGLSTKLHTALYLLILAVFEQILSVLLNISYKNYLELLSASLVTELGFFTRIFQRLMKPKLTVDKAFNTLSKFFVGQKRLKYS